MEEISMLRKSSKKDKSNKVSNQVFTHVPDHVAIIMDGNGRWAKKRGLPRVIGHREGTKVVKKIVRKANDVGVKVLTLYAFSTENWKRPTSEVEFLLKLPEQFLKDYLPELMEQNVRVEVMGRSDLLPEHTRVAMDEAKEKTRQNDGLILNFAMNYGSRDELTRAVQHIATEVNKGDLTIDEIDEEKIQQHLFTSHLPDPDLLIRTSGEVRLSNFLLWQLAYSEFWFTEVLWPDFTEEHFVEAIHDFQHRGRRYGGVKDT